MPHNVIHEYMLMVTPHMEGLIWEDWLRRRSSRGMNP
jgi:hypothetical protein